MQDLEKYFNIIFKNDGIKFKDITDVEKKSIEKSVDFNMWKMNQAQKQCREAILEVLKKTSEMLRQFNIVESTYHRITERRK